MESENKEQQAEKLEKKPTMEERLENWWKPLDAIGNALMGSLWRDVYETFQDAIALCLLFSIPGWIGKIILKADYSGFDQCYNGWNAWNVNRYACYVIVGSGFLLWITIAGRIIGRTINNVLKKNKNRG